MSIRRVIRDSPPGAVVRKMKANWQARAWHARQIKFLLQFFGRGDLCFDVGANIGDRTQLFCEIASKVLAVEPQPDCVVKLRERFSAQSKVTIEPVALAEQPGEAKMWIADDSVFSTLDPTFIHDAKSSGRFHNNQWRREIAVPTSTLDLLIAKYGQPRFLKVDVEGYEAHVFKGLSSPIPIISFEFVPERIGAAEECLDILEKLSPVNCNLSWAESFELAFPKWVSTKSILQAISERRQIDSLCWGDICTFK